MTTKGGCAMTAKPAGTDCLTCARWAANGGATAGPVTELVSAGRQTFAVNRKNATDPRKSFSQACPNDLPIRKKSPLTAERLAVNQPIVDCDSVTLQGMGQDFGTPAKWLPFAGRRGGLGRNSFVNFRYQREQVF